MKPEEFEKLLAETPPIYENPELLWVTLRMECPCGKKWVAVCPMLTRVLECPKCGFMVDARKDTGEKPI